VYVCVVLWLEILWCKPWSNYSLPVTYCSPTWSVWTHVHVHVHVYSTSAPINWVCLCLYNIMYCICMLMSVYVLVYISVCLYVLFCIRSICTCMFISVHVYVWVCLYVEQLWLRIQLGQLGCLSGSGVYTHHQSGVQDTTCPIHHVHVCTGGVLAQTAITPQSQGRVQFHPLC